MSEQGGHNPLHQFKIIPYIELKIGEIDVSFTNSALFMVLALLSVTALLVLGTKKRMLVPNRWQSIAEMSYEFIAGMVKENVGSAGRSYFPFIFTLFMFVLACNLLGMIPYSFTVTSHVIVTFILAIVIFVGVTVIGFIKHGAHFLRLFLPEGTPWWLAWLMVPIELISYLSRPISLSMRLAANMIAGHLLLKVIAGFVIALGVLGGWAPLLFMSLLTGFEIFVAFLQAYIFAILTCVYLNDAVHLH